MATSAETSSEDEEDDYFEKIVKFVLDTATENIRDDMEPEGILDIFVKHNVLEDATKSTIRDIREEPKTSDKNRQIRDICHSNPDIYVILKQALAATGQQGLLSDIEKTEREIHDSLKGESHCDSEECCALLQQLKHQKLKVSTLSIKPIQDLQQHLLHIYGKRKFWENPVSSEGVFLSQMYVQPSVEFVMEIDDRGMLTEVKERASSKISYETIFSSKTGSCENIYITGDAGKGKTTFCNQLFLHWCNAVQNIPNETVSTDDQTLLASFRFLFHIDLRYSETTYHVEDMIQEQLLSNFPMLVNISDILKTERCLIVLDGLDEWTCPDNVKKSPHINKHIPGRNTSNKNCVFLTTARSWKYDVITLKNDDRDKHIELSGVGEDSSKELTQKIIDNLDRKSKTKKLASDFYKDVRKKKLKALLNVPVLLIQLITLWHAGKDFGNSQLQLYCSILELMFERSEKNLPEKIPECSSTAVATTKPLPECFSTKDNCQMFAELLHCLAELAYKALFNKQKEEALVFRSSKLEIFGISPSNIELCLHCGILSQCKDYSNYTGKYKKFSFLHKKVQEYLAALYLVTNDKAEVILKEVKQLCNSVETMLEMNQVWLFVAGMDGDMTRQLLEHFGHVLSTDERVNTYRQCLNREYDCEYFSYNRLICDIQRCVSDCVLEGTNNGHHYENVCLEDIYIVYHNVRAVERLLFCSDMSKVKSVCMLTYSIDAAKVSAITGQFLQCHSIQRLYLDDTHFFDSSFIPDSTVAALVDNNCGSLTALHLGTDITAQDKLVTAICSTIRKRLMALELRLVKLTHKHSEQILHGLSQSTVIRQLALSELHGVIAKIDCSAMKQLYELTLDKIPLNDSPMYVANLPSLSHCVKKVDLDGVSLPVTSLRDFARALSQTKRKVAVKLCMVTFTETREGGGIGGLFRRMVKQLTEMRETEMKKLTREECGDLEGFLHGCPGLDLTECKYFGSSNKWTIKFHTSMMTETVIGSEYDESGSDGGEYDESESDDAECDDSGRNDGQYDESGSDDIECDDNGNVDGKCDGSDSNDGECDDSDEWTDISDSDSV